MKATTSLYFVIQRCQVHWIFVFYILYCNPKEKQIAKRKMFLGEISIIIILICQKLGTVGPVQQKIKLPSSNRKATHSFTPRPLIFKLQEDILKLNDICVSWISPKTGLVRNSFKLRKSEFWERQIFSIQFRKTHGFPLI